MIQAYNNSIYILGGPTVLPINSSLFSYSIYVLSDGGPNNDPVSAQSNIGYITLLGVGR